MNVSKITKLIGNINYIVDKTTKQKLDYTNIICINQIHKYSNTNSPVYRFKMDGNLVIKKNNYQISYKCIECNRTNIVLLNCITKKINKNITKCRTCKEFDKQKQIKQSNFMTLNNPQFNTYTKPVKQFITCTDLINNSVNEFNELNINAINTYFSRHLTSKEFESIRSKIISFQSKQFTDISNFRYYPFIKCHNQSVFIPMLYNANKDSLEKIQYIEYKCEKCNSNFINRDLYIQKKRYKIYCKACMFCNNTFKVKQIKNCNNENITYQSNLELNFVNFCNNNKIELQNGQKIPYEWNDKKRNYIVDFYIPQIKHLIELKDDHIWHKTQIKNGMWDSKIKGVDNFLQETGYKYMLIFPKNYTQCTKTILDMI